MMAMGGALGGKPRHASPGAEVREAAATLLALMNPMQEAKLHPPSVACPSEFSPVRYLLTVSHPMGIRSMSTAQSITRLYGLGLTPGKLRGLQRISNPNGTLTMVATDQNSSMIKMMKEATKREPTYAEITDAKVMLSRALAPHCSGLLVDGKYGYASTVAAFAVPPGTGLLI